MRRPGRLTYRAQDLIGDSGGKIDRKTKLVHQVAAVAGSLQNQAVKLGRAGIGFKLNAANYGAGSIALAR